MYNTKSLLREELVLVQKKNLLSEQSILLINNRNHVQHVLGIKLPLGEVYSLEIRKQIIEEQLILEGMLDSINKYIGVAMQKGKETAIEVVNSVKTLKDIALLFKDLILDSNYMETALNSIRNVAKKIIIELKTMLEKVTSSIGVSINGFTDKFTALIEHIVSKLNQLLGGDGWKGFLSILGFCTLVKFLQDSIFGKILEGGANFIASVPNLVGGVGDVMNSFKDFLPTIVGLDIMPILSWFTEIGVDTVLSGLLSGINIIIILGKILEPVIKSIDWNKRLQKR